MATIDDDLDFEELDDLDEEETETRPKRTAKKGGTSKKSEDGIGASAVAEKLETNPKTFRAWLRRRVEAGDFPDLQGREARSRYTWSKWTDPGLKEIMAAWKADDHTRGGRRKEEEDLEPESQAATPKKRTATRKRKTS